MTTLLWIIISTVLISLIAFIGILTLSLKDKIVHKMVLALVALSAGALMGGAFLHLIPESVENFATFDIFSYILVGFILFFLIEKVLHWRHCHMEKCPIHTFAYMNLFGDAIHLLKIRGNVCMGIKAVHGTEIFSKLWALNWNIFLGTATKNHHINLVSQG